ncbi:MAG: hypothetical protein BGO98_43060 [Myxococcales bacterium 68-20]|nr:hypothetical protein [Myxococcales bacterium]OJY29173.1 MAG: hypothetical protein BGO98_43060 [Myxococcales bacterium 68-20]
MYLDALASCAELTTEHAEEAARSASALRTLLGWATSVARPGGGAPKVLMAVARLAHADWLEGTPYVEIRGDETATTLSIFSDHGMGIRERVVPLARFHVPVDEFARAVRLAPQLIAPFQSAQRGEALLLSLPEMEEAGAKSGRESITIDERSLHEQERKTAPPPPTTDAPPVTDAPPPLRDQSGVHTHPTVRRMVAVRPEALRSRNDDND